MKTILKFLFLVLCLLLVGCMGGKTAGGGESKTSAAKEPVRSKDIVDFKCFFLMDEGENGITEYYFGIECANGKIVGSARCVAFNGVDGYDATFSADENALAELQQLIEDNSLEKFNGLYNETQEENGSQGFEISVKYASGERIYCFDNEKNSLSQKQMNAIKVWFENRTSFAE